MFDGRLPKLLSKEIEQRNLTRERQRLRSEVGSSVRVLRVDREFFDRHIEQIIGLLRQLLSGPHYATEDIDTAKMSSLMRVGLGRRHQAMFVAMANDQIIEIGRA